MKSKILSYLGVPEEISDSFSQGEKDFIQFTEGMQQIYANSPDGSKKDALALAIVENNKTIMAFLKSKNLGIYALQNVKEEQRNLPSVKEEKPVKPPKQQEPQKSKLKSFKIIWNEGYEDFAGKVFDKWADAQYAFNQIYNDWLEEGVDGTYNKVKVEIIWENGKRLLDRIDVGDKDYNPKEENLGDYLMNKKSAFFESNFDADERKLVMWEDEEPARLSTEPKSMPEPKDTKQAEPATANQFEIGDKFISKGEPNLVYTITDVVDGWLTITWFDEKEKKNVTLEGTASFPVKQANELFEEGSWVKVKDEKPKEEPKEEPKVQSNVEPKKDFSKQEMEEAIKGFLVMVKMGDEESKVAVKSMLSLYKTLYGQAEYKSKYGKLKL